jgi:hypothetical protein
MEARGTMTRSTSAAKKITQEPARPGIEERLASLRVLLEGDEQEQRETFAFLKEALDEDRRPEAVSKVLIPPAARG